MSTAAIDRALIRGEVDFEEKFFIKDDSGRWVDFTDTVGIDAVQKIGKVQTTGEIDTGQFETKGITVRVNNNDNFWLKDPRTISNIFTADRSKYWKVDTDLMESLGSYYFNCNENTGTIIHDNLIGLTGTLSNTAWAESGPGLGKCVEYNGSSSTADVNDLSMFNNATGFTLGCMVNQDTIGGLDVLFRKILTSTNNLEIVTTPAPSMAFSVDKGGVAFGTFDYSTVMEAGKWYPLVWIYDGSGADNAAKCRVYLDNELQTLSFTGTIPTSTANLATASAIFGDGSLAWDGKIDEMYMVDRVFTDKQARSLYTWDNKAVIKSWRNKECKVVREYKLESGVTVREDEGHFFIKGINFESYSNNQANLKLVSKSHPLRIATAKDVTNGHQKYKQRPLRYMFRRLLEGVFTSAEIDTFTLPDRVEIENQISSNPNDVTDLRGLSTAARPAYTDSTGKWLDPIKKDFVTRAMLHDATNLDADHIYMGINEEIYRYVISEDYFTLLTAGDFSDLGEGFHIRRLWYNTNDSLIWGAAWDDPPRTDNTTQSTLKLFNYDVSGASFTLAETIAGVFTGEWCYRKGDRESYMGEYYYLIGQVPSFGLTAAGENIVVPFSQYVQARDNPPYSSPIMTFNDTDFGNNPGVLTPAAGYVGDRPLVLAPGYYNAAYGNTTGTNYPDVRWTLGQRGFCEFSAEFGTSGQIIYCTSDSATAPANFDINAYNISDDSTAKIIDFESALANPMQPIAACIIPSSNEICIAGMQWIDYRVNASNSYIEKVNVSTSSTVEIYNSTGDVTSDYYSPIELAWNADDSNVLISLLRRDTFTDAGFDRYYLATHTTGAQNGFDNLSASNIYQYKGLLHTTQDDNICIECETGKIYTWAATGGDPILLDNTETIGINEFNLSSFDMVEVYDTDRNEYTFYGVSAPDYPNQYLETDAAGSYNQFKFDDLIFPYLDLYDFANPSELMRFDTLERLTNSIDYMHGFRLDGTYYIIKRPVAGASVFDFTNENGAGLIDDIVPDLGLDKIYNTATITPYVPVYDPLSAEITLKSDSTWNIDEDDIITSSSNTNAVNIILVATAVTNKFKWKNYYQEINTELFEAETIGEKVIKLNSEQQVIANDIEATDILIYEDTDNNKVLDIVASTDADNQTVTITDGLVRNLPAGTKITIIKGNENKWNDGSSDVIDLSTADVYKPIGTTGVKIQRTEGAIGSGKTHNFVKGDFIKVKSNGDILTAQEQSQQTATDVYSRDKLTNGRPVPYPNNGSGVKNRFYNYRLGRNAVNRIVNNNGRPRWGKTVKGVTQHILKVGDRVTVQHPVYESETNSKISCYLLGIDRGDGRQSSYMIRSIAPISWLEPPS